jgi:hypothetical protein
MSLYRSINQQQKGLMMHTNTLNHAFVIPATIPSAVRGVCKGSWSLEMISMPFGTLYGGFAPRLRDLIIEPLVDKQAIDSDSNLTAESNRTDRPGSYRCRKRKRKLPH